MGIAIETDPSGQDDRPLGPTPLPGNMMLAASSEVPADSPNIIRHADPDWVIPRLPRLHEYEMTTAAADLLSGRRSTVTTDDIAALLAAGELVALEQRITPRIIHGGAPIQFQTGVLEGEEEPVAPVRPPQEEKSFLRVRFVEDGTSEPIRGVRAVVTLPDGSKGEFDSQTDGAIEVHDLDPGTCDVKTVLDYDVARVSNTISYVTMGTTPTEESDLDAKYSARRIDARFIANVEKHKVATGESIDSLARANGLTWQELSKFNWGTDVPDEINKRLRDEVGCTKKTADGYNYMFDDSDEPGILYIPKPWEASGLATDTTHTVRSNVLRALGNRWVLVERLFYSDNETPYANMEYELTLPSGTVLTGKTDAEGYVRREVDEPGDYKIRPLYGELPDEIQVDEGTDEDESEDAGEQVLCATVFDETGRTRVANTVVEVPDIGETLMTDDDGYFESCNVEDGEYEVQINGKSIKVPTHDEPTPDYRIRLPKRD